MSLLLVHTSDFSRNIIHTYRYLLSKKIAKDRRGSWLHFMFLILSWSQWVVAWIFDTWEFDLQPGFCLSPRRIKNRVINSAWQNNREENKGSIVENSENLVILSSKYSSSSVCAMYNISNSLEMFESTKCHKKIFVKAIHNIIKCFTILSLKSVVLRIFIGNFKGCIYGIDENYLQRVFSWCKCNNSNQSSNYHRIWTSIINWGTIKIH